MDGREKPPEVKPAPEVSAQAPPPGLIPALGSMSGYSNVRVINSSDLTDTREINFEYLKHVVLKFMSSREAEVRRRAKDLSPV